MCVHSGASASLWERSRGVECQTCARSRKCARACAGNAFRAPEIKSPTAADAIQVVPKSLRSGAHKNIEPTGQPRQAAGPPRSGAGVGVGMLRRAGDFLT